MFVVSPVHLNISAIVFHFCAVVNFELCEIRGKVSGRRISGKLEITFRCLFKSQMDR